MRRNETSMSLEAGDPSTSFRAVAVVAHGCEPGCLMRHDVELEVCRSWVRNAWGDGDLLPTAYSMLPVKPSTVLYIFADTQKP